MQMVLEAGVTGDRIIFAHPCKPLSHLQYAQQHQINISTVDTEFELFKLKQHFPNSDIVLRFRSDAKICGWPLGKKFGCEAQTDTAALILLARSLQLKIAGTSFHVGCECEDLEAFVRALSTARELYDVGKMLGYDMNFVDIGGGYHGGNNEFFKKIAKTISSSLDLYFGNEPIKCISEPGRYFVEAAFTLVCKITGKREMRNALGQLESIMYFINDGKYGSFIDTGRDFSNVMYFSENHLEQQKYKTTIWGPTCDSTDKIVDNLYLPRLHRGDLLAFPNMGAYTLCLASKFNGIPLPKVVYYQQQN
ncbi:ornithine decarboxylase 1 isoform X1 [Drosophila busckii]|nr:ornithine decarboxylase 1 isoform X1 [Drosophila busckii]